jgi:excisionase family DNA binding protein
VRNERRSRTRNQEPNFTISLPGELLGPARRLLTLAEAARVLGISLHSVRRLIWGGQIPVVRLTRRVHIDLKDHDRLIEQRKGRSH